MKNENKDLKATLLELGKEILIEVAVIVGNKLVELKPRISNSSRDDSSQSRPQ